MQRAGAEEMQASRLSDPPEVRPTRVVSWQSVIGLAMSIVVPFAGAVAAFWVSTEKTNGILQTDIRHLSESVRDIKDEVKTMNAQLAAKSSKDAEQDARLIDLDRRITRVEAK